MNKRGAFIMKQATNLEKLKTETNNEKSVIMNLEKDKNNMLDKEIERHLLSAEKDIENGRVKDAREVFKIWKETYGI